MTHTETHQWDEEGRGIQLNNGEIRMWREIDEGFFHVRLSCLIGESYDMSSLWLEAVSAS